MPNQSPTPTLPSLGCPALPISALQALQQAAAQGLATPLVPVKALRALWLSLSDLSLRSWSGLAASAFPAEAQAAHFGAVAAPLVGCFAEAAVGAAGGSAHSMPAGAEAAVRRAAAAANGIVLSYAGTPKHVRGGRLGGWAPEWVHGFMAHVWVDKCVGGRLSGCMGE